MKHVRADRLFDALVEQAHDSGEPGILFRDRIERDNPTPGLGAIEAINHYAVFLRTFLHGGGIWLFRGVMLAAVALTTYGMPLVVELGIFFDVMVAVMVVVSAVPL